MGSSYSRTLRSVISEGDGRTLARMLEAEDAGQYVNRPLNKKGDVALILACRFGQEEIVTRLLEHRACNVNAANREERTALDVALELALPPDGDIIHNHFNISPNMLTREFVIPNLVKILLKHGARGKLLERLILYSMKSPNLIFEIINLLGDDLKNPQEYRISGLLLQVTVWYNQRENAKLLLRCGVEVENFWRSSFMPRIQPPSSHRCVQWPRGESGDYVISSVPDSEAVQSLKLLFIQVWRADWNDGNNPPAQFRAGLQLTPDCAVVFAQAANRYSILIRVMNDIMTYLPTMCNGPDLRQTTLFYCLTMAGYHFSRQEIQHLQLKFHIDFTFYESFHSEPQPLKHLARKCFRYHLTSNVFHAISKLEYLPESIKCYITLQ